MLHNILRRLWLKPLLKAAQAAKANEVSVAHDAAQVATQVVAAAPTDAAAQTISAAYSTTAGGMSPMALMPASDTSSAQGQQTAAQAQAQRTCVIAAQAGAAQAASQLNVDHRRLLKVLPRMECLRGLGSLRGCLRWLCSLRTT